MAEIEYIPAGRTSKVTKETFELQIQTEYAHRPNPRLTTSVISEGRVIHKIQQDLDGPVSSVAEQTRIERLLQRQHMEVMRVVKNNEFSIDKTLKDKPLIDTESLTLTDRFLQIKGVVRVFRIDNEGNFDSTNVSKSFKKYFKAVFKNMREIMEVFSQLPGGRRETGVVEIERKRLYLASAGNECFFLLVDGKTRNKEIEPAIFNAIYD